MARNSSRQDEKTVYVKKSKTAARLFSYLKEYKGQVAIAVFAMIFTVGISLVNPLLIERAINVYLPKSDLKGLWKLGIFALVLNLVYVVSVKVRIYVMGYVSNNILKQIRQEVYEHMQTLSFTFFDSIPTGKILARVTGDINSLKRVLNNAVVTFLPGVCMVIGVATVMIVKNPILAVLCLSSMPFMFYGIMKLQKVCHPMWQVFRKKRSNMTGYVHEDIAGMSVVQSFAAEKETQEVFEGLVEEQKDSFQKVVFINDLFGPIIEVCWGVSIMLLYLGGTKLLGTGGVQVGTLVAFSTYASMFWDPISNIAGFYNQLINNLTSAERVFEVLDTPSEIVDAKDARELPTVEGRVRFDHVHFTYDVGTADETKVLADVSFEVKPGERIALVGPTGAGKTTIVNLLSRFYDIQDGSIFIDNDEIRSVTIKSLRRQMGVMTQENFIFSGTVADNIRYGKADATMEEIVAAAKAVNAHDFIMSLENGYDTIMKERGAGLSIGQRQLIAFARTMVSNPRILILDEATSSIDTKTEIAVQKGIEGLLKNRTSFVIAHRLSTIQNADRIFVVDNNGIVESGSPKELMEKKGQYYRLYMAQFEEVA